MSYPVTLPDRAALRVLVDRVFPGGSLLHVRRLRGGISANVHLVEALLPDGTHRRFVLRRHRPSGRFNSAEAIEREARLLAILAQVGAPAPRPLFADPAGELFGAPALAITYEGRPYLQPRSLARWVEELARALIGLQQVTPRSHDLSFLPHYGAAAITAEVLALPAADPDPLTHRVDSALRTLLPRVQWLPETLVHDDYWPGNTIWRRGRLTAVVDWPGALVGDPRVDAAECAVATAFLMGPSPAETFTAAYQRLRPEGPLPGLDFFHLLRARRALPHLAAWLPGTDDFGLRHLTVPMQRQWIEEYLAPVWARAVHP